MAALTVELLSKRIGLSILAIIFYPAFYPIGTGINTDKLFRADLPVNIGANV